MRKILFLVTQSEFGGAQRYVYEISRFLSPEKYDVLVAAGEGDGGLFDKISELGIKIYHLKSLKRSPNPFLVIATMVAITKLLKKEKPDVLFLCSTTAGLLGSTAGFLYRNLVSKETKFQIIYRIGGWAFKDPRPAWKNKIIFILEKLTAPFKDFIIVNSQEDWREAVERKITSPEKIIKIYNGLDSDSLDFLPKEQARQALNLEAGSVVIGTVANFYRTKGLEYLIGAIAKLGFSEKPSFKLLIIGDGRLRPKIERQIKKFGLQDQVILVGRIPDAQKYLRAFDVFVLPSLKEGFPWVILEAMAAELPIVTTDVGAISEIIEDQKQGFIVETKNSQVLAEKIKWLLENREKAKIMGLEAKLKLAKEFSLAKMLRETKKILN